MSLLDRVSEKYEPSGRGSLSALTAPSQLRDLKDLKEPPHIDRIEQETDPVSVDMLRRKLLRERRGELQIQAAGDWDEIKADIGKLIAFADLEAIRLIRESGNCPDSYTAKTLCAGCNTEVPIFHGCPPNVMACVWCINGITAPPIPSR